MKPLILSVLASLFLFAVPAAGAQTGSVRVYECDTTVAPQAALRVEDLTADSGATLEDPALITLPNGMKAVQFAVRHTGKYLKRKSIIKVRYTVMWTDDCGRRLTLGSQTPDGLVLNPGHYELVQSVAMQAEATHAYLRVYIED